MFDLNEQILRWRDSLLQSESVGRADVNELETHLRESIGKLGGLGLSDEEAFLVATHRVGSVQVVAAEYRKINGHLAGWKRAWWMLLGYLVISLSVAWPPYLLGALMYIAPQSGLYGVGFFYLYNATAFFLEVITIAGVAYMVGTDAGIKLLHRLGRRLSILLIFLTFIVTLIVTRVVNPILFLVFFNDNSGRLGRVMPLHPGASIQATRSFHEIAFMVGIPVAIAAALLWLSYRHRKHSAAVGE